MKDKHAERAAMLVTEFFKGDDHRVSYWFHTPNPLLGGITPSKMIKAGRAEKLLKFIEACIEENTPPSQEDRGES